ncbi:hypothetical protein OIV40_31485, partial [Burkholderia pseudomallei]|nr:hypothetical protein [Burkholderia pseudomallei]
WRRSLGQPGASGARNEEKEKQLREERDANEMRVDNAGWRMRKKSEDEKWEAGDGDAKEEEREEREDEAEDEEEEEREEGGKKEREEKRGKRRERKR